MAFPTLEECSQTGIGAPLLTFASQPFWLPLAVKALQVKYPDDNFEAILRSLPTPTSTSSVPALIATAPEWRMKCNDCPGKLYYLGPGETLSNFEVHLRNRAHRQRVWARTNLASEGRDQSTELTQVREQELDIPHNAVTSTLSSSTLQWPPLWLNLAINALRAKYPNDSFRAIYRNMPTTSRISSVTMDAGWRIKCNDCPARLYTPGPGESLSNFSTHAKNRVHRQRVAERVKREQDRRKRFYAKL